MDSRDISRRSVLRTLTTAAGTAATVGLAVRHARSQTKLAKTDVDYRDSPNGSQRCDNCVNFEPPTGCMVVDGPIVPQGWCKAYGPKR